MDGVLLLLGFGLDLLVPLDLGVDVLGHQRELEGVEGFFDLVELRSDARNQNSPRLLAQRVFEDSRQLGVSVVDEGVLAVETQLGYHVPEGEETPVDLGTLLLPFEGYLRAGDPLAPREVHKAELGVDVPILGWDCRLNLDDGV